MGQIQIINDQVQYNKTGWQRRGEVCNYHSKPSPEKLTKGGKKDVAGLRSKAVERRLLNAEAEARYTIGFEVEKNQLHRGSVREYELFCGFERDGSCGYEAVTHILPLLPPSMWRTKVFDMMHKASRVIEDTFSPSDERCGGHITVAVDGLTGEELLKMLRPVSGIIFALYRHRLNNRYCGANLRLQPETQELADGENCEEENWASAAAGRHGYYSNGWHSKYRVALPKGNTLEWRVPSRFTSVAQMMRRYELFYELIDYVMVSKKPTIEGALRKVDGILHLSYEGDKDKVTNIKGIAKDMQVFIETGEIRETIQKYVRLQ
jgi:hypothetical protein